MQEQKYNELEERASAASEIDTLKKLEARERIHQEIEAMRAEGKALTLTEEEIQMLESFRRFRLRMKGSAEVFTWMTHRPEGVQIVEETAEIVHPNEAATP